MRQSRFDTNLTANRFEELSRQRVEKRAAWEAAQSANPTEFMGTCKDMCPEYERHEREAHFDVSPFEVLIRTESGETRIDHSRAVKKYHRPAAGNESPLPEDIRPPSILRHTMDYLLDSILQLNAPFSDLHKFIRDRTRSIRQDIIVQQRAIHRDPQALLTVIRLHEEIARFHILSGHRLCELEYAEFDPFQNTEQLRKVLQSLQEYYTDIRRGTCAAPTEALVNEPEFRAYQLLTHAEDQEVFRQSLSFPKEVYSSSQIQYALRCVSAFHQCDYVKYFKMVHSADYLQACLLHTHFTKLRKSALKVITRSYLSKESLPGTKVAEWLLAEDLDEIKLLVEDIGGRWIIEMNGNPVIRFDQLGDVDSSTQIKAKKTELIEGKVANIPTSEIIRSTNISKQSTPIPASIPASVPVLNPIPTLVPIPPSQTVNMAPLPKPPVQAIWNESVKGQMTLLMITNLISWIKQTEIPVICKDAINRERERRKLIKKKTIDRVTFTCMSSILGELCMQVATSSISDSRMKVEYIDRLSNKIATQILNEFVKKECHSISITAKPLIRQDSSISSGFSTPIPKKIRPLPTASFRALEDFVFKSDSITMRVEELKKTTSQERLESGKLDELLRRAINS